ncbi:MAG: sugar kinase [Clostridiales bacterium]|jgi:2-dehydro-3-deoxygluconokinase|nr:sugar kinase [Clostridiales bacterium]
MRKIVTFGEIMMRLQPTGYKRFFQTDIYESCFGGGEANVAVSLAELGCDAVFFTRLPDNALADACIADLKKRNVDTKYILRGGDRLGLYFCEKGASQRPSAIIYDRKGSAINGIDLSEADVDGLFSEAEWFHFSGITAALSEKVLDALRALLKEAKKRKITVSCDLNYRKKLWNLQKAGEVMSELMEYTDVLISNEEECKDVFGMEARDTDVNKGRISAEGYAELAKAVMKRFKNLKVAAFTLRSSISASINIWAGVLATSDGCFCSKEYTINVIDRVGAGDSFTAGLIYGLSKGKSPLYTVEFATAASCLKHTVEGDFNITSLAEVEALMSGSGNGRVQR